MILYTKEMIGDTFVKIVKLVIEQTHGELVMLKLISVENVLT
jgi:hypothetical protein